MFSQNMLANVRSLHEGLVHVCAQNVTVPAPPPPPGAVPPPPPPPSNGLATTIVLEVFFNQKKTWLHGCVDRELIFLASVRGPTPQQVQ